MPILASGKIEMNKSKKQTTTTQTGRRDNGPRPPPPTDAIWICAHSRHDRSKGLIKIKGYPRRQRTQLPRDPYRRLLDFLALHHAYDSGLAAITTEIVAILAKIDTSSRKYDCGNSADVDDDRASTGKVRDVWSLAVIAMLKEVVGGIDDAMLADAGLNRLMKT
jgi:hypothetical protein